MLSGHGPVIIWVKNKDSGSCRKGKGDRGVRGQRKREERGGERRRAEREREQGEQRRKEAIALKETEADLGAPWH